MNPSRHLMTMPLTLFASASLQFEYLWYLWGAVIATSLVLLVAIIWFIARRVSHRLSRRNNVELALLRGLEESKSLTEEERRKVNAALARKFMQVDEPTPRRKTGLSPMQELVLEAQQRMQELESRRATPQEPPPDVPAEILPTAPIVTSPAPAASSPSSDLPPMMRRLLDKSDIELEDMVAAGLLTEEDYQWVRRVRSRPS